MTIRPAVASDLPAMLTMLEVLGPNDPSYFAERWLGGWPNENDHGVVAVDDTSGVVGACWFRPLQDPTDIPELVIAVAPDHQRRGIGRSLLAAAVSEAKELDLSALQVMVRPNNGGSLRLLDDYKIHLMDTRPDALDYLIVLSDRLQFLN